MRAKSATSGLKLVEVKLYMLSETAVLYSYNPHSLAYSDAVLANGSYTCELNRYAVEYAAVALATGVTAEITTLAAACIE